MYYKWIESENSNFHIACGRRDSLRNVSSPFCLLRARALDEECKKQVRKTSSQTRRKIHSRKFVKICHSWRNVVRSNSALEIYVNENGAGVERHAWELKAFILSSELGREHVVRKKNFVWRLDGVNILKFNMHSTCRSKIKTLRRISISRLFQNAHEHIFFILNFFLNCSRQQGEKRKNGTFMFSSLNFLAFV